MIFVDFMLEHWWYWSTKVYALMTAVFDTVDLPFSTAVYAALLIVDDLKVTHSIQRADRNGI